MKQLVENMIRLRNPEFRFDRAVTDAILRQFIWQQAWQMIRSLRLYLQLRNPRMALFGSGVRFFNLGGIRWGRFLRLGDQVYISALGKYGVSLGDNVSIGAYSRLIVSTTLNDMGSHIRIGNNVGIGEFAYLGGAGGLEIGNNCIVGQYLSCHPENHNHEDTERLIRLQGVQRKGIKIGDNCWIGSKVTILDGVNVGNGCVLAAGAVVTRSFPDNVIIGGVPARILKWRNEKTENNTGLHLCRESV